MEKRQAVERQSRSEETDGLAHRRLDVQRLDVLPVLLEQRHEEVDACEDAVSTKAQDTRRLARTQHDVTEDLVLSHLDVADGDTEAQHLLELELDSRADLGDLGSEVLSVRDGGGELASCGRDVRRLV